MLFFVYILLILLELFQIYTTVSMRVVSCFVMSSRPWAHGSHGPVGKQRHPSLYGVQWKLKEHDLQIWRPNLMGRIGQI